jgi:light-regulated signal transduction histidine kinase (bacteriophytochrome)
VERQRVEIAELARELDSFAYAVSHDLRAPLRSIDGFSQALIEDYEAELDDQGRQFLRYVRESAQQMGRMLDDLVAFARLSRAPIDRAPVDVSALAGGIAERLRRSEPAHAVDLVVEPGLVADADVELLEVVLDCLLGNAWKFTARRDAPRVEVGRARQSSGELAFFVRDNGVGFDPVSAAKLFGAFQKLHPRQDYAGNGIGLAKVRRIVMRHGGRAWAESRAGHGATFFFTLADAATGAA